MLKETVVKQINKNNIVAIGGMIAAGKTTLSEELAKVLNAEVEYELNDGNKTHMILLNDLYERKPAAGTVFQIYQLLKRLHQYEQASKKGHTVILDRIFFEDRLFAHGNMIGDIITFGHYDRFWDGKAWETINQVGLPRLYVILKIDWETFRERIFKRGRESEINNFPLNEKYFKELASVYAPYLEKTCIRFGIPYIVLDARMPNEEKINLIIEKLNEQ